MSESLKDVIARCRKATGDEIIIDGPSLSRLLAAAEAAEGLEGLLYRYRDYYMRSSVRSTELGIGDALTLGKIWEDSNDALAAYTAAQGERK